MGFMCSYAISSIYLYMVVGAHLFLRGVWAQLFAVNVPRQLQASQRCRIQYLFARTNVQASCISIITVYRNATPRVIGIASIIHAHLTQHIERIQTGLGPSSL